MDERLYNVLWMKGHTADEPDPLPHEAPATLNSTEIRAVLTQYPDELLPPRDGEHVNAVVYD